MKYLKMSIITFSLLALVITGLGFYNNQIQAADDPIQIGYVNWAGTVAETNVVKAILENKLDLNVKTKMVGAGPVYAALAEGDIDMFLGGWLPITHKSYVDKYENEIIKTGVNYLGARIGLVVPEYVDIDSIKELKENRDKFDGKIIGIDPGAGVMKATREALDSYGLDNFELVSSSGPAMVGSLKKAIEDEEWVVVTGWKPHYKFARFDLKFLDDPAKIYGQSENIYSLHNPKLAQENPKIVTFLHDFRMDSSQLGEVMGWIADGMDPEKAGEKWVEENPEIVNDWLTASSISE